MASCDNRMTQLFKEWISLLSGQMTIHCINITKTINYAKTYENCPVDIDLSNRLCNPPFFSWAPAYQRRIKMLIKLKAIEQERKENSKLPLTKNLLGSEAVLSKSSILVIKLSRSNTASVAISQTTKDCNVIQIKFQLRKSHITMD